MSDSNRQFAQHVSRLANDHGVDLDDIDDSQAEELMRAALDGGSNAVETTFQGIVDRDYETADGQDSGPYDEDEDDDFAFEDDDTADDVEDEDDTIDPRLRSDIEYGVAHLQEQIGRKLTRTELESAGEAVRHALARGGGPTDVHAALEGAGKPTLDMSTSERRAFMVQRLQDGQGQSDLDKRIDAIHEQGGVDLDDREQRRTYIEARLAGYEDDEQPDAFTGAADIVED